MRGGVPTDSGMGSKRLGDLTFINPVQAQIAIPLYHANFIRNSWDSKACQTRWYLGSTLKSLQMTESVCLSCVWLMGELMLWRKGLV